MSDKYIIYDPAEFDKIEIKPVENSDEITRLRADLAAERDAARAAHLAPVDDEALVEICAKGIASSKTNGYESWMQESRAAIAAIRPHIEAAERERCAKIASGLCESCGGEGWLWAHELGIGLRNDDTKYSCDGQGESIACKIAAAIRRSGK